MITITASQTAKAYGPFFSGASSDFDPPRDDAMNASSDWEQVAREPRRSFISVIIASNVLSETDSAWASLGKLARERWLENNPF